MTRRVSSFTFAAVATLSGILTACGGAAGGPQLAELEVFVLDGAGNRTDRHCTELPVLMGGRARDEIDVAGEFTMVVDGTPDLVSLTFLDVKHAADLRRDLSVDELKTGYAEELDVTTAEDRRFVVFLNSRCQ